MLIDDIRQYLSKSYQAGATLRKMGICLDNISTGADIGDLLGTLVGIIEAKADRNADLVSTIKDLLEQHERQIDIVKNLTDRNAVLESTLAILQAEETAKLLEQLAWYIDSRSAASSFNVAYDARALAIRIREALNE